MNPARCKPVFFALSLVLLAAGAARAADVTFTGFATLTAGSILHGNYGGNLVNYQCPCFIGNYEYAGVYQQNQGWTADVESTVGGQADIKVDDQVSATLQVDGHAASGYQAGFDWAYLSYRPDDSWTLQAGRKRIPLYYYSDSNYMGYTYPWVRPPVDVYGWEVYSYNGINAQHDQEFGDWNLRTTVWTGSQSEADSAMLTNIYNGVPTSTTWTNIIGGSADLSSNIFGFRLVYMQNHLTQTEHPTDGSPAIELAPPGALQRIYGAAFNVDYGNFLFRSEYNTFLRPQMFLNAPSFYLSPGYRFGNVTLMYTYSQYREKASADYTIPQRYNTRSGTLRWDFHKKLAVKVQYDSVTDHSTEVFTGSSRLLTLSLDSIF